jgi:hypothetical protein
LSSRAPINGFKHVINSGRSKFVRRRNADSLDDEIKQVWISMQRTSPLFRNKVVIGKDLLEMAIGRSMIKRFCSHRGKVTQKIIILN